MARSTEVAMWSPRPLSPARYHSCDPSRLPAPSVAQSPSPRLPGPCPMPTPAFAAHAADTPLAPHPLRRREPGPRDVAIDILFCGVCHSDLHMARNEWGMTQFPLVPGHEIIGRVASVGEDVSKFKPGDTVGVGCLVDSCRTCP